MPDWTLTGLRVVVEVARLGSFSAAAEELGYTQSAVSRQVAATERAAGARLFERRPRGVTPTAAGQVVVRRARQVLDGMSGATQELAGLQDRLAGRLVVSAFPTAAAGLLPPALARLRVDHPALEVRLHEASTPAQLTAVRRGRVEVAVVATGRGLPDYDLDGLARTELRTGLPTGVAVAETHHLSARTSVEPPDLVGESWIVGPSGGPPEFGTWPGMEASHIAFVAKDWPTRLGLVAAGLGIALVPGIAARTVPQGVRWLPVRGAVDLGRTAWAVTRPDPSRAARAMVAVLVREVEQLSPHGPPS